MSAGTRPTIGLLAAAGVGWVAPAPAPHAPVLCEALGISRRGSPDGRAVHLTFDDGPHPQGTPAVLEVLAARGARATFFLVGEQVERFPSLARQIADAGHTVALHGHRHRCLLRVGPRALADDLRRGADTIEGAAGRLAPLYRPPYGVFSLAGVVLARRRGMAPWLWSRWGRDWRARATPQSIAALACRDLGPGDVVLLHDADHYSDPGCWRHAAPALELILDELAAVGLAARGL